MPTITLTENEDYSLFYHPEWKIVHHQIHKFPSSASFRAMLDGGADCLEKNHADKWLSDDRKNAVNRAEDMQWGDTFWAPRVIKAGFKYWAIVLPKIAVGQLNMKRLAQEYRRRGVEVDEFDDLDKAMDWLKSKCGATSSGRDQSSR